MADEGTDMTDLTQKEQCKARLHTVGGGGVEPCRALLIWLVLRLGFIGLVVSSDQFGTCEHLCDVKAALLQHGLGDGTPVARRRSRAQPPRSSHLRRRANKGQARQRWPHEAMRP